MNLAHTLTQSALKWPGKTALVFEGRRWTYAQWNRLLNKAAHAFRAAGLRKADRVAVFAYNLPEQVTAFCALMKIGAVPVPINYRLAANEVKYIIDDSRSPGSANGFGITGRAFADPDGPVDLQSARRSASSFGRSPARIRCGAPRALLANWESSESKWRSRPWTSTVSDRAGRPRRHGRRF